MVQWSQEGSGMGNEDVAGSARGRRERPLALVINDTQEILDLFDEILQEEGFDTRLSSFGIKEIDEIRDIDPDLIILDFLIGGEEQGWQLLQKLKMTRETQDIPVIVCSGAVKLLQELEGHLAAKNVGVVVKPFDIDDLLNEVRVVMQKNETADPVS